MSDTTKTNSKKNQSPRITLNVSKESEHTYKALLQKVSELDVEITPYVWWMVDQFLSSDLSVARPPLASVREKAQARVIKLEKQLAEERSKLEQPPTAVD